MSEYRAYHKSEQAGAYGVGGIPYRLFGGKFGWFHPIGHERGARRVSHSLEPSIDEPQGSEQVNEAHCGFAFAIQYIEEDIHARDEGDYYIHNC